MTGTVFARVRNLLIRGLAVVAVVLTYALGSIGTQVLSVAGISGLAVTKRTAVEVGDLEPAESIAGADALLEVRAGWFVLAGSGAGRSNRQIVALSS